jgi:hypothetical protein
MPPKEEDALTPEELEGQEAEALPDREVLSTVGEPPVGRIPFDELAQPVPPDDVA